jgi:hypothetical protein
MISNQLLREYLDSILESEIKLPGERVLAVVATGFKSTLVVTDHRLISRTDVENSRPLTEIFDYEDITAVYYLPGLPVIGVPQLVIDYQQPSGEMIKISFKLPGRLLGKLYFWSTGFNPRQVHQIIQEQLTKKTNRKF